MNDLKLQESHPLDENLRPIKIDDKVTPIELSNDTVRIKNLEVTGTASGGFLPLTGGTITGDILNPNEFTLKSTGSDINLEAAGGDINFKYGGVTSMSFDVGISPVLKIYESSGGTDSFSIAVFANGITQLRTTDVAGSDGDMYILPDGRLLSEGNLLIKEGAGALSDTAAYGQLWVRNTNPCDLYYTDDTGQDVRITSDGELASGGGGSTTMRWEKTVAGYKTNNNSASNYYFAYYANENVWGNVDASIGAISYNDIYAAEFIAPATGTLTNIRVGLRAIDTGLTDPLKFYVFKGTPSDGGTSISLTQIGVTSTITPASGQMSISSTDISSSNTFSEGDYIWVMYKKDSTSGNQDLYFVTTISGEYA